LKRDRTPNRNVGLCGADAVLFDNFVRPQGFARIAAADMRKEHRRRDSITTMWTPGLETNAHDTLAHSRVRYTYRVHSEPVDPPPQIDPSATQ